MSFIITDWKRMNKSRHPVDEFFSEALKNYKVAPSEEAKNAFLKEAVGIERSPSGNKSGKRLVFLLLSGIILLTCITGIYIRQNLKKATVVSSPVSKLPLNYTLKSKVIAENFEVTGSGPAKNSASVSKDETVRMEQTSGKLAYSSAPPALPSGKNHVSISSSTLVVTGSDFLPTNGILRMDPVPDVLIESENSFADPTLVPPSDTDR